MVRNAVERFLENALEECFLLVRNTNPALVISFDVQITAGYIFKSQVIQGFPNENVKLSDTS